ncbi:2OG-Fe(II) oxygenase family protein, putative [Eimeria praecox]|uniref:2OG-Fe(II) oxygenase family protein, putative n=1 Tax=Eimeria praecox TaxID=51316 RepID=U6G1T7_9EIME|nr:2OG-Fe(II) oxygenase family protein, putative [Eimeria praecox]
MNLAAAQTRGRLLGSKVEGRLNFETAYPASLGEAEGISLGTKGQQQQQERPLSSTEEKELPIGEAVPEGEHLRTLRVYTKSSSPSPPAAASGTGLSEATPTGAGAFANEGGTETAESCQGCREVRVLRVFRDPDVMIAPNLITKEQCLHLLELSDGKWTRSKTSIGMTSAPQTAYKTTESRTRTSYSVMLEEAQTPGVVSVELLACALAQMPLQHLESLVLVRYAEGEYFAEHHDGGFRPKTVLLYLNGLGKVADVKGKVNNRCNSSYRVALCTCVPASVTYLCKRDVEDGGYTHFTRLGLKIGPSQGSAALWSNVNTMGEMDFRTVHAGVAPTKGTKYVVNCFFNEAVVRHAKPPAPLPHPPPQGNPKPGKHLAGAEFPTAALSETDAAKCCALNANGRIPSCVEPAQRYLPQERQQQQREPNQVGESQHRAPGTETLGREQVGCPPATFLMHQQLCWQHEMPHLIAGGGGGAKLPASPSGLPVTGCPPAAWRTHAATHMPVDQRWV